MRKLYRSLLLLPLMVFGADEPIFPDGPSGNFPFIGRIDLQGRELDPEVQEVLYGAAEQAVVSDEDLILLNDDLDGTDFAFQNWPEPPDFAPDPIDQGRVFKRRRLHDYSENTAALPIAERFKSAECKRICANEEFRDFFIRKSGRWGIKKISAEWQQISDQPFSPAAIKDWATWTAQYEPDDKLKRLAGICRIAYKAVRMNDAFKVVLLGELMACDWKLIKVLENYQKGPESEKYKDINKHVLRAYMHWAMENETSEEMKRLAMQYCRKQSRR